MGMEGMGQWLELVTLEVISKLYDSMGMKGMGQWLDLVTLEVITNLNNSVIL